MNFSEDERYSYSAPDEKKKHAAKTGIKYEKYCTPFQSWSLEKLPSSVDFWQTDIDLVSRSRAGDIRIYELKCRGGKLQTSQSITYEIIAKGLEAITGRNITVNNGYRDITINITFKGFYKIVFEKECPRSGRSFVNGVEYSEKELIDFLSFRTDAKTKT